MRLLNLVLLLTLLSAGLYVWLPLGQAATDTTQYDWYNTTWRHRVGMEVNVTTQADRWPIERHMNFTKLLHSQNNSGTFDNSSIRVIEYDSNGEVLYEKPFQFVTGENYDNATNAHGELIFKLNGTNPSGTVRRFFIYFDSDKHGSKPSVNYANNLSYSFDGEDLTINTTKFNYTIDTDQKDNLSGIAKAYDQISGSTILNASADGDRPVEYIEYTNGTHEFSFNLSGNASIRNVGPHRMTVTQRGFQNYYNVSGVNKSLAIKKDYHFYSYAGGNTTAFAKIDQEIKNRGNSNQVFRSTPTGAPGIDANRSFPVSIDKSTTTKPTSGNDTDPYSWHAALTTGGQYFAGMINTDETIDNFYITWSDPSRDRFRVGSNATPITLAVDDTFSQRSFFTGGERFDGGGLDEFRNVKDAFKDQPNVTQFDADTYKAQVASESNATVFNRNETVQVNATIPYDPYNVTDAVNATFNMNTSNPADDDTIRLDLNGSTGNWQGAYQLANDSAEGIWTVNVSSYTEDDIFLNVSTHTFEVNTTYFADLEIKNDIEVVSNPIFANVTLQNVRKDGYITGANLSCGYGSGNVRPSNITEYNASTFPGVYQLNFSAPGPADTYTLTCNGTKVGNIGQDSQNFTTEVAKVTPNTTFDPPEITEDNITRQQGKNFTYTINVSNNESGTAYDTNISLSLPTDWYANTTFRHCGELLPGEYCTNAVEVAISSATDPDNYTVNTTTEWINPDNSNDATLTELPVEVLENPLIRIDEFAVNGTLAGGQGEETIDTFTIDSEGNYNLSSVNMSCSQGTVCNDVNVSFQPANVSNLGTGKSQAVDVNVSVPKRYPPGSYAGIINASAERAFDSLDINITVISKTTVQTDTQPVDTVNASDITQNDAQNVSFVANSTNIGDAFAYYVNTSITPPAGWPTNTSKAQLGELDVDESNNDTFYVTVPNTTAPGLYTVDVLTNWTNPDNTTDTDSDSIDIQVLENPVQRVNETAVNATVPAGQEQNVGNVTLESIGNYNISNASFTCTTGSGTVCDEFNVEIDPANVSTLKEGENRTVDVNVTVPQGYQAGNYGGEINISSTGGDDLIDANITVPTTRTWELVRDPDTPSSDTCVASSSPEVGNACQPIINNTGNAQLNLTITPNATNSTAPDQVNFSIGYGNFSQFNMTYNVTADPTKIYNATYNVSADQEATTPWRFLNVTIQPAVPPLIDPAAIPALIEQNDSTTLTANITSQTDFNITSANVTVTSPLGVQVNGSLQDVDQIGNISVWNLSYPSGINDPDANTTVKGNYTINITATDAIGNRGYNATNVTVLAKLIARLATGSNTYFQGESGLINYSLFGFSGEGTGGAQVNLSLYDSTMFPLEIDRSNPFTTKGSDPWQGYITPYPTFDIKDDYPLGIYRLNATAAWDDPDTGRKERENTTAEFAVEKKGTLDVNWDTGSVWYPEANYTAYASISDGGNLADPDTLELTVFDPAGNVFYSANMSDFKREQEGVYYTYNELPTEDNLDLGIYWTRMKVGGGDETAVRYQSFRMATQDVATGPFDIRAELLEQTVAQGSELGFNLTLINQGQHAGDSKVTYWVARNGTQYSYVSETVYTPPNQTITLARNVPIYEDQPIGKHFLNAKVEPLDSSIQPATTNVSFRVEEANETDSDPNIDEQTRTETRTRPRPPQPDEDEEEAPLVNLSIVDAPREINLLRGRTTKKAVVVANTGDRQLRNISLVMIGVPSNWYDIQPSQFPRLSTESLETFQLTLDPPSDAPLRRYNATFLSTSSQDSDKQKVGIEVFQTLDEKIQADIDRLERDLAELKAQKEHLKERGIDVSAVETLITEIETSLDSARDNIEAGDHDKALEDISTAESLVSEARSNVRKLEQVEREQDETLDIIVILGGAIAALAVILIVLYLIKVRNVRPFRATRERIHDLLIQLKKEKQQEQQELEEEKQKTLRLLDLLDAQYEEGIMEEDTYKELKYSAEEKLERINRQLSET